MRPVGALAGKTGPCHVAGQEGGGLVADLRRVSRDLWSLIREREK